MWLHVTADCWVRTRAARKVTTCQVQCGVMYAPPSMQQRPRNRYGAMLPRNESPCCTVRNTNMPNARVRHRGHCCGGTNGQRLSSITRCTRQWTYLYVWHWCGGPKPECMWLSKECVNCCDVRITKKHKSIPLMTIFTHEQRTLQQIRGITKCTGPKGV